MILQNYLSTSTDTATRFYYLGNYLLVKGHYTYLDYFADGPLEWYPEWSVDLGTPTTSVASLASAGVYRRDFTKGSVLVNPSSSDVTVSLGASYDQCRAHRGRRRRFERGHAGEPHDAVRHLGGRARDERGHPSPVMRSTRALRSCRPG
jgi:hypothetical protein